MKVFVATYTVYDADHSVYDERERVFSTMAKAIAFVVDMLVEDIQRADEWLDENQKLSAAEITEKCIECTVVDPETGLAHLGYLPEVLNSRLAVYERVVW